MSKLSLDDQLEVIRRRATDPDFSRNLIITDHGFGHRSICLEAKDFAQLLAQKRKQESSLLFKLFKIRL